MTGSELRERADECENLARNMAEPAWRTAFERLSVFWSAISQEQALMHERVFTPRAGSDRRRSASASLPNAPQLTLQRASQLSSVVELHRPRRRPPAAA